MKNVKTLLIFMITTTLLLASAQRVNSLGGNVCYWAGDDNSWTAFPHTINNSNLAQVSGIGMDGSHNAIVRWGDGTKWGFSWNQANANDMINLQWGNGTMGATFGLSMSASDNGETGDLAVATSGMGISASWGQEMGFGEVGVGFSTSSYDDGSAETKNDPSTMGVSVNLRDLNLSGYLIICWWVLHINHLMPYKWMAIGRTEFQMHLLQWTYQHHYILMWT